MVTAPITGSSASISLVAMYGGFDTIKSNGSSTYATRDLAAMLYRSRNYDFDKCLYVVAYEQNLHFKQKSKKTSWWTLWSYSM